VPERALDLFAEFRNHTNGVPPGSGAGLLGALAFHGLDGIGTIEKDDMQ
jgi:DNA polymerase-1